MHNFEFVDVFYSGEDLTKEPGRFDVFYTRVLDYVVKELSSGGVLHHEEKLLVSFNDLKAS